MGDSKWLEHNMYAIFDITTGSKAAAAAYIAFDSNHSLFHFRFYDYLLFSLDDGSGMVPPSPPASHSLPLLVDGHCVSAVVSLLSVVMPANLPEKQNSTTIYKWD